MMHSYREDWIKDGERGEHGKETSNREIGEDTLCIRLLFFLLVPFLLLCFSSALFLPCVLHHSFSFSSSLLSSSFSSPHSILFSLASGSLTDIPVQLFLQLQEEEEEEEERGEGEGSRRGVERREKRMTGRIRSKRDIHQNKVE